MIEFELDNLKVEAMCRKMSRFLYCFPAHTCVIAQKYGSGILDSQASYIKPEVSRHGKSYGLLNEYRKTQKRTI